MSDPRRHHYIPQFLLSQWTGGDGRLVRYDMPRRGKLMVSKRFPTEVGFTHDLYRYPADASGPAEQWLEQRVFQRIDDAAAKVLGKMLGPMPVRLTPEEGSAWIVFMRSLMHRTPENLLNTKAVTGRINERLMDEIREHYEELRGSGDPPTYAEFLASEHPLAKERRALEMLPEIMTHKRIGQYMINMRWSFLDVEPSGRSLLLSDDPIARTNGIGILGGHLAMPISPRRIIVLTNSAETDQQLRSQGGKVIAETMNRWTVESARHFVAAVDLSQDRFVRNRFGRLPKPSTMSNLDRIDAMYASGDAIRQGRIRRRAERT